MNTFTKKVLLAGLCLSVTATSQAQLLITDAIDQKPKQTLDAHKKIFWLSNDPARYEVNVALDKGESLLIRFSKLSDWTGGADFRKALDAATKVLAIYNDSMQEQNTQVLDIHLPANDKNIITRFSSINESGNMMTLSDDGLSALKLGIDTLRILQVKKDTDRIQYTMLLKQLSNYSRYEKDDVWKNKTIAALDSTVAVYRAKWKRPDADCHALDISIAPFKDSTAVRKVSRNQQDKLIVDVGMGVSLVRNSICPSIDIGIGLYIGTSKNTSFFVRFSDYSITRFKEVSPDRFKGYATNFLNLEFGAESTPGERKSIFYKTSLGFGYKLINKKGEDRDPSMPNQMFRMFFNYSVNKNVTITPEFFGSFRKSERDAGWFGLSFKLNIF